MGVTTLTPVPILQTGTNQITSMVMCNACGNRIKPKGTRVFVRFMNTGAATFTITILNKIGGSNIGPVTIPITTGDLTFAFFATPSVNVGDFTDMDGYINIEYTGTLAATSLVGVYSIA